MKLPSFFVRRAEAELGFLEQKEYYLPIRTNVLLQKMLQDERLTESDRTDLRIFLMLLEDRFHYEFHKTLLAIKDDFVPFDPDRDTVCEPEIRPDVLQEKRLRIYQSVQNLLRVGNYIELTPEQLGECLKLQPVGGLSVHVDTEEFEEFHVYYRGLRHRTETETVFFLWKRTRPVIALNRVFVLARAQNRELDHDYSGQLVIKIFKDVSVENLKIIAPKVKLGMPFFDRLKIGSTVFGSLATTVYKIFVAVTLSPILFAIVLSGLIIAAFKGLMSFMSSKTKYMHVYSSNLYYRNLSNNKAALTSLVDAAEEQETKETILAYFILFVQRDRDHTLETLNREVERWIEEQFGFHFQFEVDDAVRKLREKNLLQSFLGHAEEIYKVYNMRTTLKRMDEAWDAFHSFADG